MREIENQIIAAINSIPMELKRGSASDSEWTAAIKSKIREIGQRSGFLVMPNHNEGQWLYDLIWFRNNEARQLVELRLALESEWSRDIDHIQFDFEKLLIAKSDLKVMICQDNGRDSDSNIADIWKMFRGGIQAFGRFSPTETCILAVFRETPHEFEVEVIRGPA